MTTYNFPSFIYTTGMTHFLGPKDVFLFPIVFLEFFVAVSCMDCWWLCHVCATSLSLTKQSEEALFYFYIGVRHDRWSFSDICVLISSRKHSPAEQCARHYSVNLLLFSLVLKQENKKAQEVTEQIFWNRNLVLSSVCTLSSHISLCLVLLCSINVQANFLVSLVTAVAYETSVGKDLDACVTSRFLPSLLGFYAA